MKKISLILLLMFHFLGIAQEIQANVQINYNQIGGSNTQVFRALEKNLRDFINNTSWTGKKLRNFERINANFAIIITERPSQNSFKGSIVVQASRPVYDSQYETPLMNINDTQFSFEYIENENLVFNERVFSGKNLTDVIGFYVYTILGYDADSFKLLGGKEWFEKAQKIAQIAQNQNFDGWKTMGSLRSRGALVNEILQEQNSILRSVYYTYHRFGLDNLSKQNQLTAKQGIATELLKLNYYQSNYQMNYPLNIFIETKKNEIFNIFDSKNNGTIKMNELKSLMTTFAPKDAETKWNKWR
ncbi:MAG: DUF4835 family protein [Flavobacteriaceae bacterium]|nr:DUF4835 family protein [Flavobacteriaceae bacterium]